MSHESCDAEYESHRVRGWGRTRYKRGPCRLGVGFFTQPSSTFLTSKIIFTINLSSLPTTLSGIKTIVSFTSFAIYIA